MFLSQLHFFDYYLYSFLLFLFFYIKLFISKFSGVEGYQPSHCSWPWRGVRALPFLAIYLQEMVVEHEHIFLYNIFHSFFWNSYVDIICFYYFLFVIYINNNKYLITVRPIHKFYFSIKNFHIFPFFLS